MRFEAIGIVQWCHGVLILGVCNMCCMQCALCFYHGMSAIFCYVQFIVVIETAGAVLFIWCLSTVTVEAFMLEALSLRQISLQGQ